MARIPYGKPPSRYKPTGATHEKKPKDNNTVIGRLRGRRTTKQARAMLHDFINEVEAIGILNLDHINVYATATDDKGEPLVLRKKLAPIEIDAPYPVAAEQYKAP